MNKKRREEKEKQNLFFYFTEKIRMFAFNEVGWSRRRGMGNAERQSFSGGMLDDLLFGSGASLNYETCTTTFVDRLLLSATSADHRNRILELIKLQIAITSINSKILH